MPSYLKRDRDVAKFDDRLHESRSSLELTDDSLQDGGQIFTLDPT